MKGQITPLEAKTQVIEITPEKAKEMLSNGIICAWKGCRNSYDGDMPKGWRCIYVYADEPFDGEVDGVLCPEHLRELAKSLKVGWKLEIAGTEESRSEN